jgi:hypothetical protein
MNTSSKMSDKESFEENENIIMNLNPTGDKGGDHTRSNNFFHIKLDLGDPKSTPLLIKPASAT